MNQSLKIYFMAKYQNGPNGTFSGKVGTVVGSSWKGVNYMRSKGRKSKAPRSLKQITQQAAFGMVGKFTNALKAVLNLGFKDYANKKTGDNHAFGMIIKNQVSGEYPDLQIRFEEVLLSMGPLMPADNPCILVDGTQDIRFNWQDNSGKGTARSNDKVILATYCPELQKGRFVLGQAIRSAGSALLSLADFFEKEVHTWISFANANETMVATSIYTGKLQVG
jgi:Family of unknown function (DUF6266)